MNWSEGYHTEELYTYGYYKENSPTLQRFMVLLSGYEIPATDEQSVHMELGFGQGVSINIHAASQKGRYIGNDFNPNHVVYAQKLAHAAQSNVALTDASFAHMAERDDLPQVDSISLHGIWSWISNDNREHIKTIIKRCLKPGGVVYNSYNSICGHAAFIPWRDMMAQYYEQQSGTSLEKLTATRAYFKQLFDANPSLLENNPVVKSSWERLYSGDHHYILHEYFNGIWNATSFREMVAELKEVKLQFAGTMGANNLIDHLHMPANKLSHLQAQPNPILYEEWRDLLMGATFRQDVFIKGGIQLSQAQVHRRLTAFKFVPTVVRGDFGNFLFSAESNMQFNPDLFDAFTDALYANEAVPKSFQTLQDALPTQYNISHLLQVIVLKIKAGQLQPCVHESTPQTKAQSKRLNLAILAQAAEKLDNVFLACPVSGMGVAVNWMQAWVVFDIMQNPDTDDDTIAEHMWQSLSHVNKLMVDGAGNTLYEKADNIALLLNNVREARLRLPIWRALEIL